MVCYIYGVYGKGVICFSKLLLCAPNISGPQPQGLRGFRKSASVRRGEVSSLPINKTLSKGFRRKEIISQMVTFSLLFSTHPSDVSLFHVINLCLLEGTKRVISKNILRHHKNGFFLVFFSYDFYYKTFRSNIYIYIYSAVHERKTLNQREKYGI